MRAKYEKIRSKNKDLVRAVEHFNSKIGYNAKNS